MIDRPPSLLTMTTSLAGSGLLSRAESLDGMDLARVHSIPQLLAILHHCFRTITTPMSYEQLLKNENVRPSTSSLR
jgi:hypothetical protein